MNNKQGEIQKNNYQQCSFIKYMSKFMVKGTMYRQTKPLHKNIGSTYDSRYFLIHCSSFQWGEILQKKNWYFKWEKLSGCQCGFYINANGIVV